MDLGDIMAVITDDSQVKIGVKSYSPDEVIALVRRWYGHAVDLDEIRDFLGEMKIKYEEKIQGNQLWITTVELPSNLEKAIYNFVLVLVQLQRSHDIKVRGMWMLNLVAFELLDYEEPGYYSILKLPREYKESVEFWNTMRVVRPLVDEAVEAPLYYPVNRFLGVEAMEDFRRGIRGVVNKEFKRRITIHSIEQIIDNDAELVFHINLSINGREPPNTMEETNFINLLTPYMGENILITFRGKHTFGRPMEE